MKNFFRKLFRIFFKIILGFFVLSILLTVLYRFVNPPITYLMISRYFESEKNEKSFDREWKDLEYISASLPLAVIAAEDQNFLEHFGFDLDAIEKAMKHNEKKKKKIKGASTISQQVAKNVFLFPNRNWFRKGLEVYFTFLIECFWSKKRILEVYLNVAEFGDGIYGAEAASKKYFKKTALNLTPAQAALLAAVLPNPRKMNPAKPSSHVLRRQAWILNQMQNLGGTEFLNQDKKEEPNEK